MFELFVQILQIVALALCGFGKMIIRGSYPCAQRAFLVGAFSFEGEMPDYSSDLFFLQTTYLTLIGPLFRNIPETT